MSRYFTTSLFVFSTIGGVVTYFIVSSMADMPTSVLFAAITTLGISLVVPSMFAFADRKFIPLRKEIKEPIVIDERVNYLVGNEIKQGFMITTKDSMFIISNGVDKPVKFEIKKSDIKKISVSEEIYLNIFLDYDKCIRVFAADCNGLSSKLEAEGFGK